MAAASAPISITIDVTNLESFSDLKKFFTGDRTDIFNIGSEMDKYARQPIQSAVGSKPVKLTVQGNPSWKLPSAIAFSLRADANCTLSIGAASTKFSVTKSIDSKDTEDVVSQTDGMVYINIDLEFDIKGNLSGSGTAGGIGITGKASRSETATLSYCHPVEANVETETALHAAFSGLIFPFKPDSAVNMPAGSIGKVNFDGKLNCELNVTYGLGHYKLSAQTLGLAQDGVQVAWEKLKPPSVSLDAGAKASLSYTHSDHFSALVQKTDADTAFLYLLRSADNETKESVGITVGISPTSVSASVDSEKLSSTIKNVTGGGMPTLDSDAASYAGDLEASLTSKANKWLSSSKGDAGLALALSQQHDRAVLFTFKVDLSSAASADLAKQSWTSLMSGDLARAMRIGGFELQPGSGISDSFKRSSAIQLHFFNFHLAQTTDFFKNSVTKLAPDGSIRFFVDQGRESQFSIDTATTTATIHFVATATEDTKGGDNYKNAEVDLYFELSETSKPSEAANIANSVESISANADVQNAQSAMAAFVAHNGSKKLTLIAIFKPSAYRKLTCSPYTVDSHHKPHPPALPQPEDRNNWEVFQRAVEHMEKDLSEAVAELSYDQWMRWNVFANHQVDQPGANNLPSRRSIGNYVAAGQHLFPNRWRAYQPFLLASSGFMNLCDHLQWLATAAGSVDTPKKWADLLSTIEKWVKSDTDPDWSKPALGALLSLCSTQPFRVTTDSQTAKNNSSFTCTLTLS